MSACIAALAGFAFCSVGLLLIAAGSLSHGEEMRTRPRVAPWEIEPTEETKRRVEMLIDVFPETPAVLSIQQGEDRQLHFNRDPLAIQIVQPNIVSVVWSARRNLDLRGNAPGITWIRVTYPSTEPGLAETESICIRTFAK